MKQSTSVVLSVLMVVSLFSCVFTGTTVSAELTATNLIVNGDFESFNINTDNNKVPDFRWRDIKIILGNDKTKGQWYRTIDGNTPEKSPDLDAEYNIVTKSTTTYPTYFGANDQMVIEPTETGNSTNHVLRAVQDLHTQVELDDNGKYTLSFRFRLPNANTGLTSFELSFITPDQQSNNSPLALSTSKKPYNITNATIDPGGTDSGISIDSNNNIKFGDSNASEDWKKVKVTFEVKRNTDVSFPVYTKNEVNYTFPVLMKIEFDSGSDMDLSTKLGEDSPIVIKNKFRDKCIYFDDFEMYEVVNCVGAAEFYDVNGNPLPDEQAYTKVTTTVNNTETSTIYSGDKVTATVAEYDNTSGAYRFLGWYKDGVKVETGLSDDGMSVTFNATKGETYTPRFGSTNLLGSSGSFEGLTTGTNLCMTNPTSETPNFPTGNKWGWNKGSGYYGKVWNGTVYDKTGKEYQQYDGGEPKTDAIDHATVSDAQYKSGSKSLRIDFNYHAASLGIDVTPNTDYKLSYYYYTAAGQNIFEKVQQNQLKTAVVTTVNVGDNTTATAEDGSTIKVALANALSDGSPIVLGTATSEARTTLGGEWKKVDISFNSGNLSKVYLVVASDVYNDKTETGEADNRALDGVWIDNLTCYATNLTADDLGTKITKYTASNIRNASSEKAQALRHQFEIQNDLITNGNALYGELVEYGSVAIRTEYLGNRELVKDGVYNYNGKDRNAVTGVAYNKYEGTNKIYIENENSIIFTAALTGIGKTSSGTNYDAFGNSYTVRNYVIFRDRNTGKETIVYGAKVEGCVFDVMRLIMEGDTASNDYKSLTKLFTDNPEQKTAYEDWVANQSAE